MHKHHIIPKHEWKKRFRNLIGFNAPDNVVWLTLKQHVQAHMLLYELNGSEFDKIAYTALCGQIGREEAHRQAASFASKGNQYGRANKGKLHTSKQNQEHSTHILGNQYAFGCLHPPRTDEYKQQKSIDMMGKRYALGIRYKQPLAICPICQKSGGNNNMKRYHFDNCQSILVAK